MRIRYVDIDGNTIAYRERDGHPRIGENILLEIVQEGGKVVRMLYSVSSVLFIDYVLPESVEITLWRPKVS